MHINVDLFFYLNKFYLSYFFYFVLFFFIFRFADSGDKNKMNMCLQKQEDTKTWKDLFINMRHLFQKFIARKKQVNRISQKQKH